MFGSDPNQSASVRSRKIKNIFHSLCIISALIFLMAVLGWLVAGDLGVKWTLFMSALLLIMSQRISPEFVLRMYRAKPLNSRYLGQALRELAARGNLDFVPGLYYIPSQMLNALSLGSGPHSAIAVTDGLLRGLNHRELIAVLAHELSHIRNKDLWVLNLADVFSRVTSSFSFAGMLLLFLNFPLLMQEKEVIPWALIIILLFAPSLSALLQLSLSRSREFDADTDAAVLSGDPAGLASALDKMERVQQGLLARILFPGYRQRQPSVLRSHPQTQKRVQELMSMQEKDLPWPALYASMSSTGDIPSGMPPIRRNPGWKPGGLWY
ncbi:MAG: zinc metalloprotease HtpX [Desulfovermiculus sp.]